MDAPLSISPANTPSPTAYGEPAPAAPLGPPARRRRFAWRSFNPLIIFFSAVFWRDIRIVSRKPQNFWSRFIFALVLVVMAGMGVWGQVFSRSFYSPTQQLEGMQRIAPELSLWVMWVQFVMLNIVSITIAAPAFVEERTKRTLDTLALTPLTPLSITGSKFASRMVPVLILAAVPVPLLLMFRIFGGLEPRFLIEAALVTITSAGLGAAAALCASTFVKRAPNASAFGILIVLGANLAPGMVPGLLDLFGLVGIVHSMPWFFEGLACISPGVAMISVSGTITGTGNFGPPVWTNLLSSVLLTTVFLLIAAWRIPAMVRAGPLSAPVSKRSARRTAKAAALAASLASEGAPGEGEPTTAADARRKRASVLRPAGLSRTVSDRPVLWREIRQSSFRSPATRWILIALCVGFIGLIYINAGPSSTAGAMVPAYMLGLLALFVTASASTGSISGEVEAKTWSSLLNTPLTSNEIIWSKALAAMRRSSTILIAFFAHLVVVSLFGGIHPVALVLAPALLAAAMFMLCCTGMLLSLTSKRSATSATNNVLLAGLMWIGIPVAGFITFGLLEMKPPDVLAYLLFATNVPLTGGFTIFAACEVASNPRGNWDVADLTTDLPGLVLLVLITCIIHVSVGMLAMLLARSLFYRHALRLT